MTGQPAHFFVCNFGPAWVAQLTLQKSFFFCKFLCKIQPSPRFFYPKKIVLVETSLPSSIRRTRPAPSAPNAKTPATTACAVSPFFLTTKILGTLFLFFFTKKKSSSCLCFSIKKSVAAACPYTNDYSNCEVDSGMTALFPKGCEDVPKEYDQFKDKCKATCICKDKGLLYSV